MGTVCVSNLLWVCLVACVCQWIEAHLLQFQFVCVFPLISGLCLRVYICVHLCVCLCLCIYYCLYVYASVCVWGLYVGGVYEHACVGISVHMCMCVCLCVCVCVCMCVYVYMRD